MRIGFINRENLYEEDISIYPDREADRIAVVPLKDYNKLLRSVEVLLYAQLGGHITANKEGKKLLNKLREFIS